MSIERRFDIALIARMALREKQIQQNYRPLIGVHKWFARRPGTLFRGLLLAEFGKDRLEDEFFRPGDLSGIRIADPFMGGGTPLIEANRLGCHVEGFDINPPTVGDTRCIVSGHLVRRAVQDLHDGWDRDLPTDDRLATVSRAVRAVGDPELLADRAMAARVVVREQGLLGLDTTRTKETPVAVSV